MDDNFSLASKITKEEECDKAIIMMYSALMALVDKLKSIPEFSQYSNLNSEISEISRLGSASIGSLAPNKKREFSEAMRKIFERLLQIRDNMLAQRVIESEAGSFSSIGGPKSSSRMSLASRPEAALTNKLSLASKLSRMSRELNNSLSEFYRAVRELCEKMKKNADHIDAISIQSEMLSTISSKMLANGEIMTAFTKGSINSAKGLDEMSEFYRAMMKLIQQMRIKKIDWDNVSVMSDMSVISSKLSQRSIMSKGSKIGSKMSFFSEYSIKTFSNLRKRNLAHIMDVFYKAINDLRLLMLQREQALSMMSKMSEESKGRGSNHSKKAVVQRVGGISSLKDENSDMGEDDLMKQYRTQEGPFKKSKTKDLILDMKLIEDNKSLPGLHQTLSNKAQRKIDFGYEQPRSIRTKVQQPLGENQSMIGSRSNLSSQEPSISLAATPKHYYNFKDDINQRIEDSKKKNRELLESIQIGEHDNSDAGNSIKTILVNLEDVNNDETKRLILRDSKKKLKIDISTLLSSIAKNYHDGDFRPNIYSLMDDIQEDDERQRLNFEWRRLKYIFKGENVRIWGKPKNIKLDSKYKLNRKLFSLLDGLFYKKYDLSDIFNLERCRQEKGKHEIFIYNQETSGRDTLVFDDFVPVEIRGENSIVSKQTGARSLFEGESKFELAYLRPVYSGNGIISIFPSLIEKGLAKFFTSYEKMFKKSIQELAYALTRALSFTLDLNKKASIDRITELHGQSEFFIFFETSEEEELYLSLESIEGQDGPLLLTSPEYCGYLSDFSVDGKRISYKIPREKIPQYFNNAIVMWTDNEYNYKSIQIQENNSELINISLNSETDIILGVSYNQKNYSKNFCMKIFGDEEEANKYVIVHELQCDHGAGAFVRKRLKAGDYMIQIEQFSSEASNAEPDMGKLEVYSDKRVVVNSVQDLQLKKQLRSKLFKTAFIESNPQRAEVTGEKRLTRLVEFIQYSDNYKLFKFTKVSNEQEEDTIQIKDYGELEEKQGLRVVSSLPQNSFESGKLTLAGKDDTLGETSSQMGDNDGGSGATYMLTYSRSQDLGLIFL